jgi:hypothetical protein
LSSKYIYLNDDVFFARPTQASLFFTGGGLLKFFLSKAVLDFAEPSGRDLPVLSAAKNNRASIASNFDRLVTQKFKHTPHPQNRAILDELEALMPEEFASVSASKIRHPGDISVTSALHHYWAYCTGRAIQGRIRYDYFDLADPGARERLRLLPHRHELHTFCINDTSVDSQMVHRNDVIIARVLNEMFPLRSSFEKNESSSVVSLA